jgi:hypothetical protein
MYIYPGGTDNEIVPYFSDMSIVTLRYFKKSLLCRIFYLDILFFFMLLFIL